MHGDKLGEEQEHFLRIGCPRDPLRRIAGLRGSRAGSLQPCKKSGIQNLASSQLFAGNTSLERVSSGELQGSVFFPMLTSVDVSVQIKTEPILTYSMGRARSALVLYLHTLLSGGASAAAVHTLLTSAAAQALPQYILCSPAQQRKRRCSRFFAPSPDPPARQRKCRRGGVE